MNGRTRWTAAILSALLMLSPGCARLEVKASKEQMQTIKKGEPAPYDGFVMTKGFLQAVGDIKIDQ